MISPEVMLLDMQLRTRLDLYSIIKHNPQPECAMLRKLQGIKLLPVSKSELGSEMLALIIQVLSYKRYSKFGGLPLFTVISLSTLASWLSHPGK